MITYLDSHCHITSDRLYARAADLLRSLLFDYDAEHDADLGATAEAFAAAYGEVSRTAEALKFWKLRAPTCRPST